jgi:hypothetical protein
LRTVRKKDAVVLFEELFRVLPKTEEEPCEAPVEIAELGLISEAEQRSERTLPA